MSRSKEEIVKPSLLKKVMIFIEAGFLSLILSITYLIVYPESVISATHLLGSQFDMATIRLR